jgi:hypothetical protein
MGLGKFETIVYAAVGREFISLIDAKKLGLVQHFDFAHMDHVISRKQAAGFRDSNHNGRSETIHCVWHGTAPHHTALHWSVVERRAAFRRRRRRR